MLNQSRPGQIPMQTPQSNRLPSHQIPHTVLPSGSAVVPPASSAPTEEELEPIGLVDEAGSDEPAKNITATGVASGGSVRRSNFKREPNMTHTGSVRLRTFHGRLSQQGLEYMDNQVNEWLDAHPEVEVKFVTSTVGTFEGKMREPALILNLWY